MEALWISLIFISLFFFPTSKSQLSSSETKTLFQIQHILQYPKPLSIWSNSTNFCNLSPTQSLTIVCTGTHVTEFKLTVAGHGAGDDSKPLSTKFSIDSLFTVITKLPNLKQLKLVGLSIWGPLPAKISRLKSLELLDLSSNLIAGVMPESIGNMITLKVLVLNDNLFNGNLPNLNHLQDLEVINLGNNSFGPIFPNLSFNLVNITLSNNLLRSSIPEEIKNFNLLNLFDLSSNKLVGPIPSSIFSIPSIRYLNVANNQLTGALPSNMPCSSNLSYVDISKNLFTGKLPVCLSRKKTVISSWNCLKPNSSKDQHPVSYCNKQALAVDPPVMRRETKSTIKLGLILGIIGGVVGMAVVLMASILLVLRVSDRKKTGVFNDEKLVIEKTNVPSATRLLTSLLPPYHVFTNEEMEDATNNFDESNLVGEGSGSAGQIYKGWLRDGSSVLVRCLKIKQKQFSVQNLQQEMGIVSKLRHRHLVSVLGHCIEHHHNSSPNTSTTSIFIVLEQITNGYLKDHLSDWRRRDNLKWPQRMGIAIGIGRGVQFLHSGIAPGIFGNDLRIENVVLDEGLTAKLSSYNIPLSSKHIESPLNMLSTSTLPSRSENGEKDDIYQLGAILLQMISGKVVGSETELNSLKTEMEGSLVESPSRLREVIDPSIKGSFAFDSLKTAVEISIKCLCEDPNGRPCIDDFLWHMQYSVQVQEGWTSSGNLSTKM